MKLTYNKINESNSSSSIVSEVSQEFSDAITDALSEMKKHNLTEVIDENIDNYENNQYTIIRNSNQIDWGEFEKPKKRYVIQVVKEIFDIDVLCSVVIFDVSDYIYTQHRYIKAIESSTIRGYMKGPGPFEIDAIPEINFITTTYEIETKNFNNVVEHEMMHLFQYAKRVNIFSDLADIRQEIIEKNTKHSLNLNVVAKCLYYIEPTEQSAHKQQINAEFKQSYKSIQELIDLGIEDKITDEDIESETYDRLMKFFNKYITSDDIIDDWTNDLRDIRIKNARKLAKTIYKKINMLKRDLIRIRDRFLMRIE